MTFVSIDGSIGSGKSTIIDKLNKRLGIRVVQEPIEQWTDWLANYYQDKQRWGFSFQMKVILGQAQILNQLKPDDFVIMERSPQTVYHVFANMLKDEQIIHPIEYELISDFIDFNTKPVTTIYLICPPEICLERIKKRGREAEQSIELGYLEQLHEKYEKMPHNFMIDSSQSEEQIYQEVLEILMSSKYIT
tara:strand:- start:264 stop:836 length:573 start_codon:yes stop_codon:yes gene_type:complete